MTSPAPSWTHGLRRIADFREFMIVAILLAICGIMAAVMPAIFLQANTVSAIVLAVYEQGIIAIGMTILLVSGGFDLSVGSTVGLAGAITALCLDSDWPLLLAIPAGLAVGAGIGAANGLIIAKVNINPFITTLAMMQMVRGGLVVIMRGKNIPTPETFNKIGQGYLWGIQYPILIAVVLVVIGDLLLRKSRFFRQNYYIGGNEKAAVLSGIPVNKMKVFNYTLTGLLAAAAGIIMTARSGGASSTLGLNLELKVITAVIVGGASLQGGEGTVLGAFLGAILMSLIVYSLNLLGVDLYYNTLIIGATLLVAVLIDTIAKKRSGTA